MENAGGIRWGRIVAGGLLAEIAILTWGQTLPSSYLVAHALKVIGGAAGGYVVSRSKPAIDRIAARAS